MKRLTAPLLALTLALSVSQPSRADDVAGRFDYYVLSLSWAPSWCRSGADVRDANSCDRGRRAGFVVHGLWPQNEQGYPADCATPERNPSRAETQAMVDLTGSSGLAWYQWRKHGRCSGLPARDYYRLTREAYDSIRIPEVFSRLGRDVSLRANVIEDAFIEANPGLTRNGITVSCQGRDLQEVRICLTRDLQPRACSSDAARDCSRPMTMPAPR